MRLAEELRERVRGIVLRYAPLEAARAFETAGADDDPPYSMTCTMNGNHFAGAHAECRRLRRALVAFIDEGEKAIFNLLPADEGRAG